MQGFFGKLPSHGDFVTRNLPRSFLDGWDDWLQRAIADSKATLGDAWLNTYLTSPIWRFVLLPGVCGDGGWAGVLMPSVDRVGRYFPLTIAVPLADDARPFAIVQDADEWFDGAETLALSVLNEEQVIDADALETAVSALDDAAFAVTPDSELGVEGGEWGLQLTGVAGSNLSGTVAHELVRFQVGPYSLWWTAASDEAPSMGMVAPDLPDPRVFSRFLQCTWGAATQDEMPADDAPDSEFAEGAA